ncbi:hypothetical protein COO91_08507 [Nostoc flagelliforme CCNUN1]|uniref:Uncharacterized protein n=1 Tax=Nostoc flagelliforme CCNUN1 TaxID=2038116 RepID=A0A2K8T3V2_9NOSO|nr:hypothetical protein COO91_08507 [Nostoc flagelliforme CCNUN1]
MLLCRYGKGRQGYADGKFLELQFYVLSVYVIATHIVLL